MLQTDKSYYALRRRRKRAGGIGLRMAPMIDVVFLLLIFFLLAANFRSREGFLPAELPQQSAEAPALEMEPLLVQVATGTDGSCRVQIGNERSMVIAADDGEGPGGERPFEQLSRGLAEVLAEQGRTADDPVKLAPARGTRWDHVVKAYDALWAVEVRNIIFALAE